LANPTVYPAHATQTGARTVYTELGANIPLQMDKVLFLLNPNENPFTLITTIIPKREVGDDKYLLHDDELVPEHSTLASASSAIGATATGDWTVQTGHAERFSPWDIVKNMNTGSWGQVTARAVDTDILTVDGHVAILAGATGDVIQNMGNAMEEGAGMPQYKSTAHTERTNYIQRFTHPVIFTKPAKLAADYFGGFGADYIREVAKAMKQQARRIEWAFLFNPAAGQYVADTAIVVPIDATGRYLGITQGLDNYISTNSPAENVVDEADLTEGEFYDWLEPCFEFGSDTKTLYAPPRLLQAMLRWNLGKIEFAPSKNKQTLGLTFANVVTPHGMIKLINHKMLKARAAGHYHYAFLVDHGKDKVKYVYQHGLDTQMDKDVIQDGKHETTDDISTYCGTQVRLAECHGRLRFKTFS